MSLNDQGFAIIAIPEASPEVLSSFGDLKFDEYAGNSRYRRFSQYKMTPVGGRFTYERLGHRPYVTFSKYNPVAGGIRREYAPIEVDFTSYLDVAAEALGLDKSRIWQINVHQIRIVATKGEPGIVVPEGRHQDGHEYVFIGVFSRHNVRGGELELIPLHDKHGEPFFRTVVPAGHGVVFKDLEMWHDVSSIEAIGDAGYRDILIAPFSKWEERWHGDEHEARALAGG
jgi:hypothetical protein